MHKAFGILVALAGVSACGPEAPEPIQDVAVEIGTPGGSDGLGFEPLEPGGELRLQTFGQGGTHVTLAVRCIGFGNRAFVDLALKNLESGFIVRSPAPVRPQLLLCHDAHVCDLVPVLAAASGLIDLEVSRDDVSIEVSAHVRNAAGLMAHTHQDARLSTADL